ncbi:hypothetical protein [Phytohabitans aurantiacus]|uniref:Uncharacterized protein n=1 Tax=Phytohabitans aurantiacus TaxID=3016789 RepID=A0ABQ5RA19_9ACTN|nr:hypothetical protein [Phytohabitans aurantiacus]GLI03220.1 hypothetical protein Pa4123_84980 [Phytohabitans aurantiacus]
MLLRPPETVAAEAARHDLGARLGAARTRRANPIKAGWLGAAIGLPFALILLPVPFATVLLPPLAIASGVAYALLAPPRHGRRWLVAYERGFIDATKAEPVRVVLWEWALGRVEDSAIVVRLDGAAEPTRVTLHGLEPHTDLLETIDQRVMPLVVAHQLAAAGHGERLVFGPLAVTAGAITQAAEGEPLPWERVRSVRLVGGDRLVIGEFGAPRAWFSGAVPDAPVAVRVIAGLRPAATVIMPDAVETHAELIRRRRRRALASLAGLVALALLPGAAWAVVGTSGDEESTRPVGTQAATPESTVSPTPTLPPGVPETVYGYSAACLGRGFPGAPPYQGPGPHPIYVNGAGDARGPDAWYTEDVTKIQLVACGNSTTGRVLKKCEYLGINTPDVSQDMVLGRYTFEIREARTARVLGQVRLDGEDTYCRSAILGTETDDKKQVSVPFGSQIEAALRKYVDAYVG